MKINESKNYEDGSTIHALSADASLENVFSPNGDVRFIICIRAEAAITLPIGRAGK